MRSFINYCKAWLFSTSRPALLLTVLLIGALVTANYTVGIESRLRALPWYFSIGGFWLFYCFVLALVWGLQFEWHKTLVNQRKLLLILILAPLYFSLKMVHWDTLPLLPASLHKPWDHYTMLVTQLPLKLLLLFVFLWSIYKAGLLPGSSLGVAIGLTRKNFNALPYFGLLALMIPLIALASTQHDFLLVYPKVKNLAFINGYAKPEWPWKLLYEISYGLDFLGIELFFRGLLVVALISYVGQDARASSDVLGHGPHRSQPSLDSVVPMAAFYCTIHFGKPLAECISSFFGGIILGVLAARTRTILGGLIVHLGLAWLMELGGWLGSLWHR